MHVLLADAMEHILKEKGKKERLEREVTALLKAFSLAVPDDRAMNIKEVGLFQAIKSAIAKTTETGKESQELIEKIINRYGLNIGLDMHQKIYIVDDNYVVNSVKKTYHYSGRDRINGKGRSVYWSQTGRNCAFT